MSSEITETPTLSLVPHAADDDPVALISEPLRKMVASLVLDTTSEGIWLIDAEARTTFVNQHTASLLGYSVAEMLGELLTTFMDDEGRKICEQNLERRKNGVEEQHEFRFVRKDGSVVWTLLATNPVYDRSGRYAGALAMVANLTEQKFRERRLAERVRELEGEVASLAPGALPVGGSADAEWLESLAAVDSSATLGDRRYFTARVAAELSQGGAQAGGCCVLLLALDGLSSLSNPDDTQGLLRAVVAALSAGIGTPRGMLRSPDTLARFADDTFAILATNTDLQGAIGLAEQIFDVVRAAASMVPGAAGLLSVSLGVAAYPLHAMECADLLAAADGAVRDAQRHAGGAIGVATIPRLRMFGLRGARDQVVRTQSTFPSGFGRGATPDRHTPGGEDLDDDAFGQSEAGTIARPPRGRGTER